MLKKLLTEPLIHFLFIAIFFFAAYDALNPDDLTEQTIVISEGRVELIKNQFVEAWKRKPSEDELASAIERYALNEIYLREAKALGLAVGDQTINRRLRQKMDFMLEDMASGKEASDTELKAYYEDSQEQYRVETEYSFTQVYISIDRSKKELDAILALQTKNIDIGIEPSGEAILLPRDIRRQTKKQLIRRFGKDFVFKINDKPLHQWFGPVNSGFGKHFVRLTLRETSELKPFEELSIRVKSKVLDDWQTKNIKIYTKNYEEQLLALYHIDVFMPSEGDRVK